MQDNTRTSHGNETDPQMMTMMMMIMVVMMIIMMMMITLNALINTSAISSFFFSM
ncbi:hypothetical protein E2C01_101946 [Portunus trituberculatus]|uniref:Uncharacterized protein n=1 Tax=Portunus trituberculatus TaxID=210409 RepID=A0A5B7KN35_PORTR|nr:hypothetical protein [Portunus trituberculatus]